MIIDIHTHAYPDRIAQRVLTPLSENSGIMPVCDGSLDDTRRLMRNCGVDKFALLPVATTPLCQSSNLFSQQNADEMLIPFGTVHPAAQNIEAEVEQLAEMGMRGIKLHPQYQHTRIDDERYERLIRRAAALGLAVIFHAGTDPGLPLPWMAMPCDTARLLDRIENIDGLVLIAAHMGGFAMFDDVERYLVGRNIYFDTSCIAEMLEPQQYARIIEQHGYERIIFGSDCPWQHPDDNMAAIRRLQLPPEQEKAILGGNAARLLHLDNN